MAAVIGDFISDPARFHTSTTMISSPLRQPLHSNHDSHRHRRSSSNHSASHPRPAASTSSATTSVPREADCAATDRPDTPPTSLHRPRSDDDKPSGDPASKPGLSRLPSPPPSSSPSVVTRSGSPDNANALPMAPYASRSLLPGQESSSPTGDNFSVAQQPVQQPSPAPDHKASANVDSRRHAESGPRVSEQKQTVINVRDLSHVQSLAKNETIPDASSGLLNDPPLQQMKYEISAMPIGDIIEMVAALLTKITSTNDLQHDAMQRNVAHQQQANQSNDASGASQMSPLSHSVLAFHGKNVPGITILSYLTRIHKYCPTTYEVFLSLLVYFDRMTERVNDMVTKSEELRRKAAAQPDAPQPVPHSSSGQNAAAPEGQGDDDMPDSDETDSDLADDDEDDDDDDEDMSEPVTPGPPGVTTPKVIVGAEEQPNIHGPSTYFVVDSFNIHRLMIAGITCASKFFSDVFYTNSRYAKVGGLPLPELNHLELQFLILNDFRLAVPVEDLEAYATMLVEFYAREVASKPATETAA